MLIEITTHSEQVTLAKLFNEKQIKLSVSLGWRLKHNQNDLFKVPSSVLTPVSDAVLFGSPGGSTIHGELKSRFTEKSPVKHFPILRRLNGATDPLQNLERCEDFLDFNPLTDEELIATLQNMLHGTARDLWSVGRHKIYTWKEFQNQFHAALLAESISWEVAELVDRSERTAGCAEALDQWTLVNWSKQMADGEGRQHKVGVRWTSHYRTKQWYHLASSCLPTVWFSLQWWDLTVRSFLACSFYLSENCYCFKSHKKHQYQLLREYATWQNTGLTPQLAFFSAVAPVDLVPLLPCHDL